MKYKISILNYRLINTRYLDQGRRHEFEGGGQAYNEDHGTGQKNGKNGTREATEYLN